MVREVVDCSRTDSVVVVRDLSDVEEELTILNQDLSRGVDHRLRVVHD